MHIKGVWEASSTACDSDTLCDPAVLVSPSNAEPHIRNRRLSPGSGNCGGGGGGCISGSTQPPRQLSPEGDPPSPGHAHALSVRRDKERRGQPHKGRSLRREGQRAAGRPQKAVQKEKWVEDSLSLLRPPPAFPVQDSPAKLQPAVSYASKVKAGPAGGALDEDRPAIGMLLQNQWGLSFISEARPAPEGCGPRPPADALPSTDPAHPADPQHQAALTVQLPGDTPTPASQLTLAEAQKGNGELLLSCRHLVEALNYHSREWNIACNRQKRDPRRVLWYKDAQEQPA